MLVACLVVLAVGLLGTAVQVVRLSSTARKLRTDLERLSDYLAVEDNLSSRARQSSKTYNTMLD